MSPGPWVGFVAIPELIGVPLQLDPGAYSVQPQLPHVMRHPYVPLAAHVLPSAITDLLVERLVHDESEYSFHRATAGYDE